MTIGRRIYGLGAVTLGIPGLVFGSFAVLGQPVPAQFPFAQPLAYAAAALLVLAGLAANLPRTAAIGSLVVAVFFALSIALLHLPQAATEPMVWVSWENLAEKTVMALGGVLAWAWQSPAGQPRAAAILRIVRPLFGVCVIVFGTSEFVYAAFTAAFVPAWLPPSGWFWAYLTATCQIAAGLAMVSGVQARLAAILLTAMYLIFSLIVHLPRVFADPTGPMAWAENGSNLVLAGAVWVLADSLAKAGMRAR